MSTRTLPAATSRQLAWIGTMLAERGMEPLTRTLDIREASAMIDTLKATPRPRAAAPVRSSRPAAPAAPAVPDGRYALRTEDGVKFYKINTPDAGRWAGYTFVNAMASDDTWPIKNRDARASILSAVGADITGAAQLYGREIGACGRCGRTLTDETSRAYGIGPECRKHF